MTVQPSPDTRHLRLRNACRAIAANLPVPQRQDSLEDQLVDLHILAAKCGMYDAADWLWKTGLKKGDRR